MSVSRTIFGAVKKVAAKAGLSVSRTAPYDVQLYGGLNAVRDWSANDVIFDVGANDGRTIFRLQRHLPLGNIYAFEPVSSTFAQLSENTARLSNIHRFKLALGSDVGRRKIYLNEISALNSLHAEWGSSSRSETIDMTTLDRFVQDHEIPHVHLLKIDAEGHDLEVLKGARETLRRGMVDVVMVEAGFAAPGKRQPTLQEFQDYLRPLHYHLYGIYQQARASLAWRLDPSKPRTKPEILVHCDALFIRAGADAGAGAAAKRSSAVRRRAQQALSGADA